MKKVLLALAIIIIAFIIFFCYKHFLRNDEVTINFEYDTLIDSRDGQKYKTVKIGDQIWMAENLNYKTEDSKCYGNDAANCDKYGRLYSSNESRNVCPEGWHLSTNREWLALLNEKYEWSVYSSYYGDRNLGNNNGKKLKAKSGWSNGGNGTDDYGFSALPGGYGKPDGTFNEIGDYGGWWHIEIYTYTYDFFGWYMYYSSNDVHLGSPYYSSKNIYGPNGLSIIMGEDGEFYSLSVRCVKNHECGETTYDSSKEQECCDNKTVYRGFDQFCLNGKVYDGCGFVGGGDRYDPETEYCDNDEVRKIVDTLSNAK